jgi:hypothetical protein
MQLKIGSLNTEGKNAIEKGKIISENKQAILEPINGFYLMGADNTG